MKLIVVGASGFVGGHLLRHARDREHETVGTQCRAARPDLIDFDLLEDRIGDCVDPSLKQASEPVFGVICAVVSRIDYCRRHPELSYQVNVEKTTLLINDLLALGVKPVFLSTSFVFDGIDGYYTESDPRNPISEYGRHKEEVERYLQEDVPGALILRLDKVVGDSPDENHLFSEWYRWSLNGSPITCISDQFLSPTSVDDIASAVLLACEAELTGVYHVANRGVFARDELARQFFRELGRDAEIVCKTHEELNLLDRRPLRSYLDSTKFVKATGMQFTSMREVFQSFVRHNEGLK